MLRNTLVCSVAACAALATTTTPAAAEFIQLRSGQSLSVPGTPGQTDDIVTFGTLPGSGAFSASPFTATDFNNSAANPATVIQPVSVWLPGLTFDSQARWINHTLFASQPFGAPGSALYRVPFTVTTTGITSAIMNFAWASDDNLGDQVFGGANPFGAYLRDPSGNVTALTPATGGGYSIETTALGMNVTGAINTGLNELFVYQRDQGFSVSGVIFSATFDIIPAPGASALAAMGLLVATRRRRA
jgi:uncharacterized protein (TIGR03382 family)